MFTYVENKFMLLRDRVLNRKKPKLEINEDIAISNSNS